MRAEPEEIERPTPTVDCPVLGVWSDGNYHLAEEQMTDTGDVVDGP